MTTRTYASPDAFKQAVEQRLRTGATGPRLRRSRQLLVFERFLARIVTVFGDAATLNDRGRPAISRPGAHRQDRGHLGAAELALAASLGRSPHTGLLLPR